VPYVDPAQRSEDLAVLASQTGGQQKYGNFEYLQVGAGATAFKVDSSGMWLGADTFAAADFSCDMNGNVILNSVVINGLAGDILAGAINADGNFINYVVSATLNTQAKTILGEFTFAGSGAIAIKTDADNGIWISPTGLLAKKAGANTFAIDNSGNATFGGSLVAASGTLGAITVGSNAWHVDSSGNMWWGSSTTYAGATIKISSAGAVNFTSGTFSGTVSGASITGSTFKANEGSGVDVWIGNDGYIRFRYGSANKAYISSDTSGYLVLDSDSTIHVRADNEVALYYNYDGGGNNFYVFNGSGSVVAMFLDSSNNMYVSNGDIWAAGNIQCGSTFMSSDGSSGVNKGPYGFVTAVESSRAKFREITVKDGLITNIGGETDWL